jgi:membrane fusion protein, heavy metal efflux system
MKTRPITRTAVSAVIVLAVILSAALAYRPLLRYFKPRLPVSSRPESVLFKLVPDKRDALVVSDDAVAAIHLETIAVSPARAPDPLRLPGQLGLDPNNLVPVHARFPGEVVEVGTFEETVTDENGKETIVKRRLRYGDPVKRDQILAMIWSTDIGQKKSEMVDAISKHQLDRKLLQKLESVGTDFVPRIQIETARRNVEADRIAITAAERTLRSWRLTEEEITEVRHEALQIVTQAPDTAAARTWAELEIRSPIDGNLVEKNVNPGTIVDTNDDLMKVADLSRIQVLASVYEEDLPFLDRLSPAERQWEIDLKADAADNRLPGKFETIGVAIDPTMHTGALIGWVDNAAHRLRSGQFVTATIRLPPDPEMVEVPASALIEEGATAAVFVETDAERHEVTRRAVAVTRRGQHWVFIRAQPNEQEQQAGAQPLHVGEKVVMAGGLELNSELLNLQNASDSDAQSDTGED